MREGRAAAVAGIVVIGASLIAALPQRLDDLRVSGSMLRIPCAQRRAAYFGAFWTAVQDVARRFPAGDTIPVVLRRPSDVDSAVFLTFYSYPRVTKYFWSLDHYRAEAKRPADAPIVYADASRGAAPRIVDYAFIRDEQLRDERPLHEPLPADERRFFVVPMVVALDGAPPDAYTTQIDLLSAGDASATVVLEPDGVRKTVSLRAGERLVLRDVLWKQFARFGSGWLRIEGTAPLRAGAWLINRGRGRHVAVALFGALPPLPQEVGGGDRLWLLNADDAASVVDVNGTATAIPPRALMERPSLPANRVSGRGSVLAFSSRKLPDGNTSFHWPKGVP